MDFNFPFPTLKRLSMVSIGQQLVHNTGPSHHTEVSSQFKKTIGDLPVPQNLEPEILAVTVGMHDQYKHWMTYNTENFFTRDNVLKPEFDVNGIVDDSRTWQTFFQNIPQIEELNYWRDLLEVAFNRTLLPYIGMILRKMMIVEGLGSMPFFGPHQTFVNERLILVCTFGHSSVYTKTSNKAHIKNKRSVYEIFCCLNDIDWPFETSCNVTKGGIKMRLNPMRNMDTLKRYHSRLPFDGKLDGYMLLQWLRLKSTEFITVVLKLLNPEDQREYLEEYNSSMEILICFLRWPFIRFFIPLMTYLGDNFSQDVGPPNYFVLFWHMVRHIPGEQELDVLGYGDLLLEFWHALPSYAQAQFGTNVIVCTTEDEVYEFHAYEMRNFALKRLSEKNGSLCSVIAKLIFSTK